jgi:hypothetical protein
LNWDKSIERITRRQFQRYARLGSGAVESVVMSDASGETLPPKQYD